MAIQLNTIEYGWETNVSTVSGSNIYTFPSKSIFIPETGSRQFISADVYMYVRDGVSRTAMPSKISTSSIGLWIDNNYVTSSYYARFSGATGLLTTGDHFSLVFRMPFVSHFNSFFTGSSHILQPTFLTPTGSSSIPFTNHSTKVIITYKYDDDGIGTGIKTVRIPLGTYPTQLPATTQVLIRESSSISTKDAYNVPLLDTFLPETSKVYRDMFFEVFSKDASNATTLVSMSLQLSSGSISQRCVSSSSLNTSVYIYDIYNVSGSIDTATTHSLKAASRLGSRFSGVSSILNVTYEYSYTGSTRIINSVVLPLSILDSNETSTFSFGTSDATIYVMNLFIPESNPSASQSGIVSSLNANSVTQVKLEPTPSSLSANTINLNAGSVESGPFIAIIRIDCSPYIFLLSRGQNTKYFKFFNAGIGTIAQSNNCYCIINYTSDVMVSPGYSTKTVYFSSGSIAYYANNTDAIPSFVQPSLDYSKYYISGILESVMYNTAVSTTVTTACSYGNIYSNNSNETSSFLNTSLITGDGELGFVPLYHNKTYYKKNIYDLTPYKTDYSSSKSVHTRRISLIATNAHAVSIADYLTFSNLSYPVSCSLLNCNYSSSAYDIRFYVSESINSFNQVEKNPINILYLSGSSVNKSGSFSWFDNFQNIYAICYTPEFGISNMLPAGSGSHIIDFSTSSASPSEHSFTFIG